VSWVHVSAIFLLARRHYSVGALAFRVGATDINTVQTIPAPDFDPDIHYRHDDNHQFPETPVLVESVLDPYECETMCDTLMAASDSTIVTLQRKLKSVTGKQETSMELHDCTLTRGIDAIMDSTHADSRFVFQEGLLEQDNQLLALNSLSKRLYAAQESLFTDEDWLQHFPSDMRPSSCVVMAGEGATSTLHRDPLEWTGTSLCLEGTKVWRFMAPSPTVQVVDELLHSYRLESIAWDGDEHDTALSAGWQSDFNLFDTRSDSVPSAQALNEMESVQQKYELMMSIARDTSKLEPNLPLDSTKIYSVIQKPGDLLVIPAHWWHQTYGLEPSITVASQRCGTIRDAPRLVHHILETAGLAHDVEMYKRLYQDSFEDSTEPPRQIVGRLFQDIAASLSSQ
jgi:hypothetical protein